MLSDYVGITQYSYCRLTQKLKLLSIMVDLTEANGVKTQ